MRAKKLEPGTKLRVKAHLANDPGCRYVGTTGYFERGDRSGTMPVWLTMYDGKRWPWDWRELEEVTDDQA
jgi:hypothetical protein